MSEITKAELEAAVVGNMVHMEAVANASKPKPDVLERLKDRKAKYLKLASGSPTDNYISPMAARKVAEELVDAIAEIKNTRNLLKLSLDALKLHQLEFEIRREDPECPTKE